MTDHVDRSVLPIRRPPFGGVAGKTLGDSQPDWGLIGHVKPPAEAPNVLLVLIDDAGFGNPGTFGGLIDTPHYDRMASHGLRSSDLGSGEYRKRYLGVKIPPTNLQEHHLQEPRKFADGLANRLLVSTGESR